MDLVKFLGDFTHSLSNLTTTTESRVPKRLSILHLLISSLRITCYVCSHGFVKVVSKLCVLLEALQNIIFVLLSGDTEVPASSETSWSLLISRRISTDLRHVLGIVEDFLDLSSEHSRVEEDSLLPLSHLQFDVSVDDILVLLVDFLCELLPVRSLHHLIDSLCPLAKHMVVEGVAALEGLLPERSSVGHPLISCFGVAFGVSIHGIVQIIGQVGIFLKAGEDFFALIMRCETIIPACNKLGRSLVISVG